MTNKLTYSDSPFFSNWSQTYFTNLTLDQHIANNKWLMNTLTMLKDDGVLYVPCLDKSFNKLGEEINTNFDKSENKVGVHKLEPISYYNHNVDIYNIVKEEV